MASAEISSVGTEFSNPKNSLNSSFLKITILVVDDDSTSLAIITAMLKEWRYEVASVKTPKDALSTLRAHPGIDLVVTDLHMPEMNGIELQKQINREFKLPVIIMSSDDKESVMLESLAGGAVFFIVKPVNPDGLKNVWQYAVAAKKGKSVVIEEIGSFIEAESSSSSAGKLTNGEIIKSVSSVANDEKNNDNKNAERGSKRKASRKGKDGQEQEAVSAPKKAKKAKVVWTNSLHNQFLEALSHIGLEKAVPKKILEHMNVQGLTRENVASHLQKYRIFLKRVAERSCFSSKVLVERFLKSSFASGHPLLMKTAQEYSRLQEMQRMSGPTYQQGYGGSIYSAHNAARHGFLQFANQTASSSNSAQRQHGYGQSSLLGHQANKRLVSGNMNPPYQHQGNRLGFANRSNLSLNGRFSSGLINASNGPMKGANSMQTYRQQIQGRPDFYNAGSLSQFRLGSSGLHSYSSTPGTGIIGSVGASEHPSLNPGCSNNNSYAGMRLTTNGQLIGMGQTRLNGGYGSMNRTCNENVNVASMGNQTFHFMAQGGFSSSGLDGTNQDSPALTAAHQQANTSMLPGLANSGVTDYNSDQLMNNAPNNLDNTTDLSQQLGEGYLSDVLLESNKYQFSNQEQQGGGDGSQNPEFSTISSTFPEVYPTLDELLNSDFSELLPLDDTGPWSEQALNQVQSDIEKLLNTNIAGDECPWNESNPTQFVQNINQQQREGGEQLTDSDPSSIIQANNAPAEVYSSNNENWEHDDFLDSLLSFGTHFE